MIYNYCTLFDSNYIDRGLLLINSLDKTTVDYRLYVLTMDKTTFDILSDFNYRNVTLISLPEFEDDEIMVAKKTRSWRAFCWTCSSCLIDYLIKEKNLDNVTYIDADMYFYASPNECVKKIKDNGCSVGIVGHRFPNDSYKRNSLLNFGKYCVEFNTFYNEEKAIKVLDYWKSECLKMCVDSHTGEEFGDQKYLDRWPDMFEGIYEIDNPGVGIAPWNIADYRYNSFGEIIYKNNLNVSPIFYHFHDLHICENGRIKITVMTRPGKKDEILIHDIYSSYIARIEEVRKMLMAEYGLLLCEEKMKKAKVDRKKHFKIKNILKNGIGYYITRTIMSRREKLDYIRRW